VKALLWTEWLLVLRDRRATAAGVVMVFLLALAPHLILGVFGGPPDLQEELGIVAPTRTSGDLGWVVEGPRPAWLAPALGTETTPEALVRFWTETGAEAGVHFEVLGLVPGARLDQVADQVKHAAFAERQDRAAQVGMLGPWEETVEVVFVDSPAPDPPFQFPDVPLGAVLVLIAGTMGSLSWVMEALPRARSGGWLESLAALPLRRGQVVLAWLGVAASMTLVGVVFGAAGHAVGGLISGETGWGRSGWLVPIAVLLFVPLQVLAFATASDLRASVMRSLWVLPGATVLVLAALICATSHPAWVPWIPVGGLVVACLGLVGPSALPLTLALAAALSLAAGRACVALLEGAGAQVRAVGRVAERRARGNWFPEAGLLVALGIASVVAWSPGIWGQDVVRVLLTSHLLFYALPALAAPRVLGLPARELLPMRWPGVGVLLLAGLGACATLSFGVLVTVAQQALMPLDPFWTKLIEDTFLPLSGGASLLLLALLPGICEELLFRGAVLGLLRKGMPGGWAVLLQAALFAVAHLYGFRWLPTFGVGLAAGWLVLRTGSLLPAMVLHTLHNGLAAHFGGEITLELARFETQAILLGAMALGVTALALAGKGRAPDRGPAEAPP
jgi:membrane protease YdiL (CAAX protease family)